MSRSMKRSVSRWGLGAGAAALAVGMATAPLLGQSEAADEETMASRVELGSRLYRELLFTNPAADYGTGCAGCHAVGSEVRDRSERHYADYTARSMMATKELTLRNTPTLHGADSMELFGWTGEYDSLERLIFDKLIGLSMGWRPADRERALAAIHFTLLEEGTGGGPGKSYADHFQEAYGADLAALGIEEVVELGARALADYVRSLESTRTAPWDAFVEQNRIRPEPNSGEPVANYAYGVFTRIGNQEGRLLVKRPKGFSREAYEGFKTFFRTFAEEEGDAVGNCVVCHVPPRFTDLAFHNKGISELEYERVHGKGTAARYPLPSEPTPATAAVPEEGDVSKIDLGRWNAAPEEVGAIGAFKTPTLRNLGGTDPYMHNGAYATLEEAVAETVRVSELARAGELPNVDPEIEKIELTQDDIAPLVAFLRQLNEVDPEDFRSYLIELADD